MCFRRINSGVFGVFTTAAGHEWSDITTGVSPETVTLSNLCSSVSVDAALLRFVIPKQTLGVSWPRMLR